MAKRPVEWPSFLNLWKTMFFVFYSDKLAIEPRIDIESKFQSNAIGYVSAASLFIFAYLLIFQFKTS